MASLASDVYGKNPTRDAARRMISRSRVKAPRASTMRTILGDRKGDWCGYAGQQWSSKHPVSCDCACHFDPASTCDVAFGRGNRCDGTKAA